MTGDSIEAAARDVARRLDRGGLIAISTGAGMSRESGIPTFRGAEGVWRQRRAEDVATPQAFRANPGVAWEFHDHLRSLAAGAAPNVGHEALARLAHRAPSDVVVRVITQNIDRLHEEAGSREVIHLHGDILRVVCTGCGFADDSYPVPAPSLPPRCDCGALLRPDIVLFGEPLPETALEEAWQLSGECAVMVVVGTSMNVQPAASLPFVALEAGALIVEVNPEATMLTAHADHSLRDTAAGCLPGLVDAVLGFLTRP